MPRLIRPGPAGPPMGLGEAAAALEEMRFDPQAPGAWEQAAPILARLSADRGFLGAIAVAGLADRVRDPAPRYGPQVLMLHKQAGWFLRANMWPAADDALLRASGGRAFFYDVPHDHNFSFLTINHHGPGYVSDYWTYDAEAVTGLPGEAVSLRFVGRHRLKAGRMMLYRSRIDVHDQKPPAAFSVTLNLMEADGRDAWCDQYRFDVARGCIAGTLNSRATEATMMLAAHLGGGDGRDVVTHLAASHPVDRIRFGAVRALAGAAASEDDRIAILEAAATRRDPYVAPLARRVLEHANVVACWSGEGP